MRRFSNSVISELPSWARAMSGSWSWFTSAVATCTGRRPWLGWGCLRELKAHLQHGPGWPGLFEKATVNSLPSALVVTKSRAPSRSKSSRARLEGV